MMNCISSGFQDSHGIAIKYPGPGALHNENNMQLLILASKGLRYHSVWNWIETLG